MYTAKQIRDIVKSKSTLARKDLFIDELLIDSRKLSKPRKSLFFAIRGDRLDGHNYIADLYKKGIRNFVIEKELDIKYDDANFIMVPNTVLSLQKIAQFHREHFDFPIIGITGSNGKTIVKEWSYQLLQKDYKIVRSPKSFNSQVGVPLSVWNIQDKNTLGIFEAGISEPNEMDNLQKIIQPTIGIFTNIGSAHGQHFINDTHKVKEKLKFFLKSKVLIYCKDHATINQSITDYWKQTANENTDKPSLFSWSANMSADLRIVDIEKTNHQTTLNCIYKENTIFFEIPFLDTSSIENAIHCIALMLYLNYEAAKINTNLKKLKRIEMRLERKKGLNNSIIINDSYNSDLESLRIALDFLVQQEQNDNRMVILSDILQSGISSIDLYSSVVEMLENAKVKKFIGIGEEIYRHKYLFNENEFLNKTTFYASTNDFLENEIDNVFQKETILIKGARNFQFERINTFLEEKVHTTVFEINLNAIVHNLNFFTSKLKSKTKIMVMVKAFAYGAGIYEIAKLLEFHRVDYLGVAYADEGTTLRKAGIKLPIMVLNPEKSSFETMIRHKLEPDIYSFGLLKDFTEALNLSNITDAFPVHINIDTGMKRLGFETKDLEQLALILSSNKKLKIASIYTHLAASDEKKCDNFSLKQIEKFNKQSTDLITALEYKPLRHVLNSNGIIKFSNAQFDMVRLGLGLYGINKEIQENLEPIGSLKSRISQIRDIEKGETIGYGRIGKMNKKGKIAIIAIGYADGLNRLLSNGVGNVYIKNTKAKIIGNVCMDMTMIDISNIDGVEVGDEVEVFGKNIPVSEVARQTNTITYEVLTSISERVQRVFFVE